MAQTEKHLTNKVNRSLVELHSDGKSPGWSKLSVRHETKQQDTPN